MLYPQLRKLGDGVNMNKPVLEIEQNSLYSY